MRLLSLSQSGIMSDEFRTCATAAANDVHDAFIDEFGDLRSHRFSRLVIFAHFVRQSGIRMGAYIIRCHLSQMLDKRLHLRRTEGTVHAHREDRIRRERCKKSINRLTAQGSSSQITHRQTDHDRQLHPMLLHHGDGSINHRLAVERIKDGFDENHVRATLYETIHLFAYIGEEFIVCNLAGGRIADVRTHGASLVGWSHISSYEAWLIWGRKFVAFDARQSCALERHLAGAVFQVIICLRDALAREGIGCDNVGASLQVASVDVRDNVRASDVEHVVVALHHSRHITEPLASEVILGQIIFLNLRTHGTVKNQNLLLNNLSYIFHYLKVLNGSIHFSSVLFLLQGLTLVILLLTLAEGDIHLGTAFVIDEDERRNDGEARLLAVLLQSAQFALGKQQFAVSASLVVAKRAVEVRRDVHPLHPKLTLVEIAVAVYQRRLTTADRLNLSTREHDARGISINEEVFERSLLVAYLYRTLFTEFLFLLVHIYN